MWEIYHHFDSPRSALPVLSQGLSRLLVPVVRGSIGVTTNHQIASNRLWLTEQPHFTISFVPGLIALFARTCFFCHATAVLASCGLVVLFAPSASPARIWLRCADSRLLTLSFFEPSIFSGHSSCWPYAVPDVLSTEVDGSFCHPFIPCPGCLVKSRIPQIGIIDFSQHLLLGHASQRETDIVLGLLHFIPP